VLCSRDTENNGHEKAIRGRRANDERYHGIQLRNQTYETKIKFSAY